jgi:hydroxyacylglutathione hydrolase
MLIVKQFTFNPLQENTYVVHNKEGECCIIDPGCYFDYERRELSDYIQKENLTPRYLLNTHCHLDHIFGNRFVHEEYNLPLHLHEKEKWVLDYAPSAGQAWGLPIQQYEGPTVFVGEQSTIDLGADAFSILLTPGHSPGSICFYSAISSFIISGDVLFRQSIGRTDLPGGDHDHLLESIATKLWPLPPETIVYPGHGPQTTIGYEKKHNPFLHHAGR